MIRYVFIGLLLLVAPAVAHATKSQTQFTWKVTSVVDGDTLNVDASKDFILPIKVRVLGIDTPEKGHLAKCRMEAERALEATKFTTGAINSAMKSKTPIVFKNIAWDKYGGRVLADVYIGKELLSDLLVNSNLAYRYNGRGKKNSWCD